MFKELAPVLRHRAVLMTITSTEDDQIRVNVVPKKLKDDENKALTTPITVTGTAEELDAELPSTLVSYVASHLQLKNILENAKGRDGSRSQDSPSRSPRQIEDIRQEGVRGGYPAQREVW